MVVRISTWTFAVSVSAVVGQSLFRLNSTDNAQQTSRSWRLLQWSLLAFEGCVYMPWLRGEQKKSLPPAALHLDVASRRSPTHADCTTTPQDTHTYKPKRRIKSPLASPLAIIASRKSSHIPRAPDPLHPNLRQCPKVLQVRFEPAQKKCKKEDPGHDLVGL
jgi:hypothetical protein